MSAAPRIDVARASAGIAELRIRIPPVNVLSGADLREITRCVTGAGERVLVLSGLPRAFSAGVEVAEHVPEPEPIEAMLAAMRAALTALLQTPAVTVASVSGACLGGGAEIAAGCDFVLVSEEARIGFPEIELACFPPGAVALLSERIGPARATDWILSGKAVSGREAAAAGFASRAVPAARLAEETRRLARSLARRSEAALSAVVPLLRRGRLHALEEILPRAEEAYRGLAGDADLARAVRDFPNRRQP
ncbi:MAG: enoyl-CoA hydratase/isomerase family protein [Thermoanaerobaculia bacterium]